MTKIDAMNRYNNRCVKCNKELKADKNAHFHHLRSYNKQYNMSTMFGHMSEDKTKAELDKTVLLCKDCHIALHKELGKKVYKKQSLEFINR